MATRSNPPANISSQSQFFDTFQKQRQPMTPTLALFTCRMVPTRTWWREVGRSSMRQRKLMEHRPTAARPKMNIRTVVRVRSVERQRAKKVRSQRAIEDRKIFFLPQRSANLGMKVAERAQPAKKEDPIRPIRAFETHSRCRSVNQLSKEVSSVLSTL